MSSETDIQDLEGAIKQLTLTDTPLVPKTDNVIRVSTNFVQTVRYNLRKRVFDSIKQSIIDNYNQEMIESLKTTKGDTQVKERISIEFVRNCIDSMKYSYKEAGSQQSKDFQNIQNIGLNIEVKKTDSSTVYFNDTLPSIDIFYVIIFTGKTYKRKSNIEPQILFVNGYDLCKKDLYYLLDYKKDIEHLKNKWARKKKNSNATKFTYFSVYPRPTYKMSISHLLKLPSTLEK